MNTEQSAYLEAFFKAHFSELQVHAFRFLEDWGSAKIAVMDAFEIACEKMDVFSKKVNQMGWMKNVVKNVCKKMIRQRSRDIKLLAAWEEVTEKQMPKYEDSYSLGIIEQSKELLTEQEFQMLRQAILIGIPYDELAKSYGISMWACRKRVQRALEKLRKFFEKDEQ